MVLKEYAYTAQSGPGYNGVVYRPLIEVKVSNKTGEMSLLALIDSGTDSTLVNAEIAKTLYIEPNTCQKVKVGGVGENIGFLCNVTLSIDDFSESMEIPVIFVENLPFDALLGQRHFFERFQINFEKDKNRFFLGLV